MPIAAKTGSTSAVPASSTVSVANAKANLSSILRGVEKKHGPVTILRRGVPVAQLVPFPGTIVPPLRGSMAGTARILGDILSPLDVDWTGADDWTGGDE